MPRRCLFLDGADHYVSSQVTQKWTQIRTIGSQNANDPTITDSAGRRGGHGIRLSTTGLVNHSRSLGMTVIPADNTFLVGAGFRLSQIAALEDAFPATINEPHFLFQICDIGQRQIGVQINTDGTLAVKRGGDDRGQSQTLLGNTGFALQEGVFYYIWLKGVIDDSNGYIAIIVNGDEWLELTSQDTQVSANTATKWNNIRIGPCVYDGSNAGPDHFDYDDIAIFDGESADTSVPCGDLAIYTNYPQDAGSNAEWDPDPGPNNFEMVDEGSPDGGTGHDGDDTIVSTDTVGNKDTYEFNGDQVRDRAIIAVQVNITGRAAEAGTSSVGATAILDSVEHTIEGTGQTETYSVIRKIWDENPETTSPWVPEDFDAPNEFGFHKDG